MKKRLSDFKENEIKEMERKSKNNRIVLSFLTTVSVGLVLNAIAFPKQPKPQIIGELGIGGLFALGAAAWHKSHEEEYILHGTYLTMNREIHKEKLKHSFAYNSLMGDVVFETKLANDLSSQLSPAAQARYMAKFNLHGLMLNNVQESQTLSDSAIVSAYEVALTQDLEKLQIKHDVDLSWIDSDFINSSKIVIGGKGSGKSTYLRYEAARWLVENQPSGGTLVIIDPHYDIDDKSKWWLNDLPQTDVCRFFLAKHPEDRTKDEGIPDGMQEWRGYRSLLRSLSAQLRGRISGKIKDRSKIKIILDEEENLKRGLSKEDFEDFLSFVDMVQDEGRKYGFEITIGAHGMKKENTGLDSNTIAQMNWLLFEKACYDPTTKFPDDFDKKYIKDTARQLSNSLPKGNKIGKIIVVIKQDLIDPIITILPLLHPPIITLTEIAEQVDEDEDDEQELDSTTSDADLWAEMNGYMESNDEPGDDPKLYYSMMVDWYKLCMAQFNKYPDPNHLKQRWEELTGTTLTETALVCLINKLMDELNN